MVVICKTSVSAAWAAGNHIIYLLLKINLFTPPAYIIWSTSLIGLVFVYWAIFWYYGGVDMRLISTLAYSLPLIFFFKFCCTVVDVAFTVVWWVNVLCTLEDLLASSSGILAVLFHLSHLGVWVPIFFSVRVKRVEKMSAVIFVVYVCATYIYI